MSVTMHPGDCRAVLATLPDASVQCVVTSPPYFGLRDYGVAGQIGLEPSPDAYVAELVSVFREVRRVLADSGTVWLNLGDSYVSNGRYDAAYEAKKQRGGIHTNDAEKYAAYDPRPAARSLGIKPKDLLGIPWMVAFALRADGWYLRSDVIWAKPNPMPESVTDRPTSAHEHVFLLSKRASYYWDAEAVAEPAEGRGDEPRASIIGSGHSSPQLSGRGGFGGSTRNLRNVWTIATQPYSGAHFAVMPAELAERCIKAGTSERGQCPHCAAPWARVVERERTAPAAPSGMREPGRWAEKQESNVGGRTTSREVGWQPTCACPEHKPVPQTVLDPFAGAGTTGLVADRLGRNAVLIELNPAYAGLARDRITDDAPLFANVALAEATTSRWAEAAD